MSAIIVYVTTANRLEAEAIGRNLVENRLAACVNIVDGMESIYRWQGKVESAREAVLWIKTTAERLDAVTARVKAMHSYDCPCIVYWPLVGGTPPYLDWIENESRDA